MPTNSLEYMRKTYKKYHGTKEAIKKRTQRVLARRIMEKKWLVKKWDWKEVDHKNWMSNSPSNLRVISMKLNRQLGQKRAMKARK